MDRLYVSFGILIAAGVMTLAVYSVPFPGNLVFAGVLLGGAVAAILAIRTRGAGRDE